MKSNNNSQIIFNGIVRRICLTIFLLIIAISTNAAIKYVMYGGAGNKSGSSWANASDLLRQTIDGASAGDEVWVAGGDNTGNGVINYDDHFRMDYKMVINKNIKIYGGFPRPTGAKPNPQMKDRNMVKYATIFDGTIMFAAPIKSLFEQTIVLTDALFDGFYVVNATDEKGAGIRMKDGLTISNCVFVNNKATSATEGGGAIYMEGGTLVNCVITNNEATNMGAAIYAKGNSKIINCTVVNNKTNGADGRAVCIDGSLPSIDNTIFWNNSGNGNDAAYVNGASVAQIRHCSYNLLPGSSADNTLISTSNTGVNAPYFVAPNVWQGIHTETVTGQTTPNQSGTGPVNVFLFANLGDWYLQDARSVMFDKGDQTLIPAFLKTDIENNPRVRNKFVDIGCYELQPINVLGWVLNTPKVYNGNNYGSVSNPGAITPAIANVGVDSVMVRYDNKNVGTGKSVTLSFILNGSEAAKFFAEDTIVTSGVITALPIAVTADSISASIGTIESFSKIYGESDPTFTYRTSPALATGDAFTGALSRSSVATQTVGSYNVTQGTLSAGSNYSITFVPTTFNIVKKSVMVTAAAVSKTYDGNTTAPIPALSFAASQLLAGDVSNVTAAAASATYDNKNVGANKTVSVSGITISGTASGNYKVVSTASNSTSSITKRAVDANIYVEVGSTTKVYDGNTSVTTLPSLTLKGLFGSDVVSASYNASTTALFDTKNVGTNKSVTISNIVLTGADVNNYTINTTAINSASSITIRPLDAAATYIAVGPTSKTFDGTTTVTTLPTLTPTGLIGSDVVTATYGGSTTATFDTKNVGNSNKTVTVSNIVLGGADVNNYTISTTSTNTASTIAPLAITIVPDSIVASTATAEAFSKTYGSADPTFTYRNAPALKGSDVFSGALDRTSGATQTVGSYNITLGSLTAGANYTLALTASPVKFNIVKKAVTVSNIKISDRPFTSGNVSAPVKYWGDVNGAEFGDALKIDSMAVTNSYYTSDALGGNKPVFFTPSLLTLQGAKKDNYRLIQPVVKGNVGVASTVITISNNDVTYNGSAHFVTVTTNPSDPTHTTVVYKIAGTSTVVAAPTLAGSYDVFVDVSGGSYVSSSQGTLTIRKKNIVAIVPDVVKKYDGSVFVTPIPTLTFAPGAIEAIDLANVTVSADEASFSDKNASGTQTLTVSGIKITGSASGNYSVLPISVNSNSSIVKRDLDASIYIEVADTTKIYNGSTLVAVPTLTIHGLLGGDNFKAVRSTATANFDTKNVGSGKTVTVTGYTFSNPTLAANYTWAASYKNMNSSISQRGVDPTIYIEVVDTTKVYDGSTSVAVPTLIIHGLLGGDNFKAIKSTATASFDTKDVGTAKIVTVSGYTFTNATLAANYSWAPTYQNMNSSITKRALDPSIYIEVADTTKIYDGLISVAVPTLTIHGLLGGDNFKAIRTTATATFDNKNVGTAKIVTVIGYTFTNSTLAANYTWAPSYKNSNSSITQRGIDPTVYIEVADTTKVYDGSTSVSVPSLTIRGLLGGDTFKAVRTSATATFDTKNIGTGKTVTVTGFTFTNPVLAGNYSWASSYQNTNSSITQRSIDPSIYIEVADTTKMYDGSTSVIVPSLTIHGLLGGDNFSVNRSAAVANFDTKDVGTGKTVTVENILFTDPILASNYSWAPSYHNHNSSITTRILDATIFIEVADTTKEYNGNRLVSTPKLTIYGLLGGDNFTAIRNGKQSMFDTKDVGTDKVITVQDSCWTFSNTALAANYSWATSYKNGNSSITSHPLDASIYIEVGSASKVYDGNRYIATPALTIYGLLGGDVFTAEQATTTTTFDTKDAATNKTITVTGITFSNPTLADNYTWASEYYNTNSSIVPFNVAVTPDSGQKEKFDQTDDIYTYTTEPNLLPANELLSGSLTRVPGADVGIYNITQGSITNSMNPNYNISFTNGVTYEIFSGLYVGVKWGYSLYVNNANNQFTTYQWYKDGSLVSGQTLQHYTIEHELCGTYKVKVTTVGGDTFFSQDTTFTDCSKLKSLVIVPTLVKPGGVVSIKYEDATNSFENSLFEVMLYRIDGTLVDTFQVGDISDYRLETPQISGTYIIKVIKDGATLVTQKIVVY